MLEVLRMEGLKPGDTLVDLGCGTGRLAVHAVPMLEGGRYIGIDISRTMLGHARALLRERVASSSCAVEFRHQTTHEFLLPDRSVDRVCAFSVFTHMEHEDNYRYLRGVRRIIKGDGRFIFSCLPMDLEAARRIFEREAALDTAERWGGVRNVTTSRELMDSIARMAGWEPLRWYPGDQPCIRVPGCPELRALGQSVCVLAPC
jgi:cyclopropane fatty-acyl-phospholipid synthase-like methyltransferase